MRVRGSLGAVAGLSTPTWFVRFSPVQDVPFFSIWPVVLAAAACTREVRCPEQSTPRHRVPAACRRAHPGHLIGEALTAGARCAQWHGPALAEPSPGPPTAHGPPPQGVTLRQSLETFGNIFPLTAQALLPDFRSDRAGGLTGIGGTREVASVTRA